MPSGPGKVEMPYFRYRLHWDDGGDAGEAEYVSRVKPGELIWIQSGEKLRVLGVIDIDEGKYEGLLRVEAA